MVIGDRVCAVRGRQGGGGDGEGGVGGGGVGCGEGWLGRHVGIVLVSCL